jgi:alpha-tubulin suppressor-like RCC1 family protein
LIAFGENANGQCGTSKLGSTLKYPTLIFNAPDIVKIYTCYYRSYFILRNGDLYGCGKNKNKKFWGEKKKKLIKVLKKFDLL